LLRKQRKTLGVHFFAAPCRAARDGDYVIFGPHATKKTVSMRSVRLIVLIRPLLQLQ